MYRISVVSYLNSRPFIHGLKKSGFDSQCILMLDHPADCAAKLLDGRVDIGLVPVAIIPDLNEHYIVSDYCIGADGPVDSVKLFSRVPLEKIRTILLDYQSRTSVQLVQVLARELWKINPDFLPANQGFEQEITDTTAAVIIGDRAMQLNGSYLHSWDLSAEWKKLTGLPFVFACWVSNRKIEAEFIEKFNAALGAGLHSIDEFITESEDTGIPAGVAKEYLKERIQFDLTPDARRGMEKFLAYLSNEKVRDLKEGLTK